MSIESYLLNIKSNRNAIREKLISLGLASSEDQLEHLAAIIEGIVNHGSVTVTIKDGETYSIPAGLHDGSGTVTAGASGNYDLQTKSVIPTKAQQRVVPDEGFFGLSSVLVESIPSMYQDTSEVTALSEDVLTGKIIVLTNGALVTGSMPNNGAINKIINGLTITSINIPAGYTSGGTVSLTDEIENRLSKI